MALIGEMHSDLAPAGEAFWGTIHTSHFDPQRKITDQLASATKVPGARDPSDSRTCLFQMPFGHIQQRGGAMEVAPALRVAQDFDPLQDFRLERRPEALHLGDAAGMACLFQLAERVDPQLFVKFQHLVRTQSRDREQLENTFRYVLAQGFQRWVRASPMKPLDNPSY